MTIKRKTVTSLIAGVAAAAMVLGGTFAWTSISQQATNESAGTVNVGGRLHDDFNGTNKDVYVENFTDPLKGGQPIYARVMLTEYMEIGQDAGGVDDGDNIPEAVPVVPGTKIDDVTTWTPHKPAASCAECETTGTCRIHSHWEWIMGNDEAKVYMPTFNKDKDSLAADINGTYHGTNPDDKIYYDNYVTYVTENGAVVNLIDGTVDGTAVTIPTDAPYANALTEANKDVTSVTGNAQYDNDPDNDPNTVPNDDYIEVEETHTAKETPTAVVITMAEWLDPNGAYNGQPGNFWVYDTDGWAYWANPIMPGEATGLLLSNIQMTSNPGEKCYYAINVIGQFATVNDWTSFDKGGAPSDEAQQVLTAAANNVATVTVTNVSGTTMMVPGGTYEFTASVSVPGAQTMANSDFQWSVLDADLNEVTTGTTIVDGVLTVSEYETAKNLIVVAKAVGDQYLGALGLSSAAVATTVPAELEALAETPVGEKVTIDETEWWVLAKNDGQALIWSVESVIQDRRFDDDTNAWSGSEIQTYLNGDYFESLNVLKSYAAETKIYTAEKGNRSTGNYIETTDKVFLLTEADVFGTANGIEATDAREYTLGEVGVIVTEEMKADAVGKGTILRSPRTNDSGVACIMNVDGTFGYDPHNYAESSSRPAMWVNLVLPNEVTVTTVSGKTTVAAGGTLEFAAAATKDGLDTGAAYQSVTWSVTGGNGTATIDADGILTVDATETHGTVLTVTATSTIDNTVIGEKLVTVHTTPESVQAIENIDAGTTNTVTIDGIEWYVLAKQDGKALIWSKDVIGEAVAFDATDNRWDHADVRTYLRSTFLNSLTTLKNYVAETTIYTAYSYNRTDGGNGVWYATTDKVFLLSEADVWGTANDSNATATEEYTLGVAESIVPSELRGASQTSWLRSPHTDATTMATLSTNGGLGNAGYSRTYYLRPAMWVNYDPAYNVTITEADGVTNVEAGKAATLDFSASVTLGSTAITNQDVIWSVEGGNGTATIDQNGVLTIDASETAGTLTVKATSKVDSTAIAQVEVTLYTVHADLQDLNAITLGSTDTVTIDDVEWYVLAKENGKVLIWAADTLPDRIQFSSTSNQWSGSNAQDYLNNTFLPTLTTLQNHVVETTIKTAETADRSTGKYIETTDKVFLLAEADLYGHVDGYRPSSPDEFTYGNKALLKSGMLNSSENSSGNIICNWLRSPRQSDTRVAAARSDSNITQEDYTSTAYLRPAMWIDLAA